MRSSCTDLIAKAIVVDRSDPGPQLDQPVVMSDTCVLSSDDEAQILAAICASACARNVPEDAVRFLLTAPQGFWDTGSSRNLLLLLTRGSWVLSSDDDVDWGHTALIGDITTPSKIVNEWDLSSFASSPETLGTLVADATRTGCSLTDLLRRLADSVHSNCAPTSAPLIELGSYGESGYGSWLPAAIWVFRQAQQGLTVDDAEYRALRTCSWVLRAPGSLAETTNPSFLSMAYLLDNTRFVPPFFPFGRGDDGLWATMRLWCDRSASVVHAPVAVKHDPPEVRGFTDAHVGSGGIRYIELVQALLENAPVMPRVTDPGRRLQLLGQFLASIAAQPTGAFIDSMRAFVVKSRGRRLHFLRATADDGVHIPLPPSWHTDMRMEITREEHLMCDPMALIPEEIVAGSGTLAEVMEPIRESLQRFGAALTWWPQLLTIADQEGKRWLELVTSCAAASD